MSDISQNRIEIGGLNFNVETLKIDPYAEDWNLTIVGEERRVKRLGDELCKPRIMVYRIATKGPCLVDTKDISVSVAWDSLSDLAEDTYFTLMGEGFSIISCNLKIFRISSTHHRLELRGVTDYPLGLTDKDEYSFAVICDFVWGG